MANPVNPNQQNLNPQKAKNPQNRDQEQHNQREVQKNVPSQTPEQNRNQGSGDQERR